MPQPPSTILRGRRRCGGRARLPFPVLAALATMPVLASAQCEPGSVRRMGPQAGAESWPRLVLAPNITYDPVDGRVVLIGLSPDEDRIETWVWDGYVWSRQFTPDGIEPPPVRDASVLYHEGSGRVLMFGGRFTSGQVSGSTWVWDGYFWSQPIYIDSPPPPRALSGAAYISLGDQVVLIGGVDAQGDALPGIWSWATTSESRPGGWIELQPAGPPPPPRAARHGTVYEVNTQTLYYVDPNNISGEWRWDPRPLPHGTFTNLSNQPAPGNPNEPCAMAFDSRASELTRFVSDATQTRRWVRTDAWRDVGGAGDPLPSPIYDLSVTFDTRLKKIIIVGREFPHDDLQLWEYDSSPTAAGPLAGPILIEPDVTTIATAQVRGVGPFEYLWHFNGVPIEDNAAFEGSRSRSLAIATRNARCYVGQLTVRITSPCGSTVSPPAILTPPGVADFNGDGGVDGGDVQAFYELFAVGEPAADVNCDGGVDGPDIETFFICWQADCDS